MPMTTKNQIKQPRSMLDLEYFLLHDSGNTHQQIFTQLGELPNCVSSMR